MNGSDTLFDVTQDVLAACPNKFTDFVNHNIHYFGGGSGTGAGNMANNLQQTSPMSRALKSTEYCGKLVDTDSDPTTPSVAIQGTTEGLLVGLDGIAVVANAANACVPNGVKDNGSFPVPGQADYIVQSSFDVLRLLYGGLDHDGNYDCNGPRRRALVTNWNALYSTTCAAGGTACPNGLSHVWRRSDLSGTSDAFNTLVAFTGRGIGGNPSAPPVSVAQNAFCNSIDANMPSVAGGASPVFPVCSSTVPCPFGLQCDGAGHCNGPVCGANVACPTGFACSDPTSNPADGVCNKTQGGKSDFADFDPIRIPCLSSDATQSVCSAKAADGLGLVLPIFMGDTPNVTAADEYPQVDCDTGKCSLEFPNSAAQVTLQKLICPDGTAPLAGRCFMPFHVNADGTPNFQCRARKVLNHCFPLTASNDGRCYNKALVKPVTGRNANWALDNLNRSMGGSFFRIHANPTDPHPCNQADATLQIGCLTDSEPCSLGYAGREAALGTQKALAVDSGLGLVFPTDQNIIDLLTNTPPVYPLSRRLFFATLVGFNNLQGGENELAQCYGDNAIVGPAIKGRNFVQVPGGVQCLDYDETLPANATPLPGCASATNNNACVTNPPVIGPTQADVQAILSANCTTCHSGPTPPQGLDLTNVGAVVGTASNECATKLRINAGSSATSYLVDKILGAAQDGGCFQGVRMPASGPPFLTNYQIARIAAWIDTGAH
jgi:hypothetical protein